MKECENSIKYIDSFQEKKFYYIVTELCDNSLRNKIKNNINGFSISEIKKIFCQINVGLKYLINKKYLHRDIKPDNILINEIKKNNDSFYYKYILCHHGPTECSEKNIYNSKVGTSLYEAPEIKTQNYTNKSDLFSKGKLLYELYYGNKEGKLTQEEIIKNLSNGIKIKDKNDDINEFNKFKNLIEQCIRDENNRIDWDNYFKNPLFYYEIEIIIDIKEEDLNNNIRLIGKDFKYFQKDNTILYVDNKKEESFKNEYNFNSIGKHVIKLILNNNLILSLEKIFMIVKILII